MLQIQKQNKFLRGEVIAGSDSRDSTPRVSGTPEQNAVMRESREQRNALASETLEKGQKNEAVMRAQAMLQKLGLYNKTLDGDYGTGTEAAVKSFQSANGLPSDGKIGVDTALKLVRAFQEKAGLQVDGIVGPNTLAALTGRVQETQNQQSNPVSSREESTQQNRNPVAGFFEALFGWSRESIRYNKFDSLKSLDDIINSASGLGDLEKAIDAIKNTKNQANIDRVYTQALQVLKNKIPDNLYRTLSDARNTLEKAYVLSFVANALMGGRAAPERIRENDVASIIAADTRNAASQEREWAKALGLSMASLREMAHQGLSSRRTYEQQSDRSNTKRVLWSLRSKNIGGTILSGLQAYAGSSIETVKIRGNSDSIEIAISVSVLSKLVAQLDIVQLNSIKRNVLNNTRLTDDQVRKMILDGTIKTKAFYAKSANCFNDAIGLSFTTPTRIPQSSDRDRGHDTPGEWADTSSPDTGGESDNGGGGPDGDGTGTRG